MARESADRHTEADEQYLDEVARALEARGFRASAVLLYGEDRSGLLIGQLKREPVDLLVVGFHGHGAFMDLMLGQTVDKVRARTRYPHAHRQARARQGKRR